MNPSSKPMNQKSEYSGSSPRKRWAPDEDRLLMEGMVMFKGYKFKWHKIKSKIFANSIRTNVNLKDRARTLGLE